MSEAELIKGCKKGKSDFQAAFYQQFAGKMFGVCLRYSRSREMAEDILQEAFIKIFQKIRDFRGSGSLEGWVRRIVVNTALDELRKVSRFFIIEGLDKVEGHDNGEDPFSGLTRQEILREIQELPDGFRAVLNLYLIEGYNHREISEMLGISEGTSKSQLARAKARLRTALKPHYDAAYGNA